MWRVVESATVVQCLVFLLAVEPVDWISSPILTNIKGEKAQRKVDGLFAGSFPKIILSLAMSEAPWLLRSTRGSCPDNHP